MRAPQRGGDWGHWHVPSQGPCWSAPQLCKWRSPSCDPSCGWGYVTLAACVSTYAALLNPSSQACPDLDRKSTRLNSSHGYISYAVFCLKKKKKKITKKIQR